MKALVSIHPRFARLILSGEKKCEYRRRLPAKPISGIVIYATSPVSRIIGEAGVEAMPFLEKGELWRQTSSFGGGIWGKDLTPKSVWLDRGAKCRRGKAVNVQDVQSTISLHLTGLMHGVVYGFQKAYKLISFMFSYDTI